MKTIANEFADTYLTSGKLVFTCYTTYLWSKLEERRTTVLNRHEPVLVICGTHRRRVKGLFPHDSDQILVLTNSGIGFIDSEHLKVI